MKEIKKIKYKRSDKERICMPEKLARGDRRTDFERDRARIIHSAAFRRLQGKTQVFTAGEGDFFRTRLTHSLEVAQISKALALRFGADTDLVEAISLAHDIGHPPFGHSGEEELNRLMKRYGGFEANAQNIRILTKLESKSEKYEGLNLTRATIDGQLKYKKFFDRTKEETQEKFLYEDDKDIVDWASKDARTTVHGWDPGNAWKSFECEIMDKADDIAYAVHDLEDSLHAGFIDKSIFHRKAEDPRIKQVEEEVAKEVEEEVAKGCISSKVCVPAVYRDLRNLIGDRLNKVAKGSVFKDDKGYHRQRKANRKQLTSFLIDRYVKAAKISQRKTVPRGAIPHRYFYKVHVRDEKHVELLLLKGLIKTFVYESPRVKTLQAKGKHIIRCLFLKLMSGDNAKELLPEDWKEHLKEDITKEGRARVVCDYIAGMTDDYAQKTYSRLFLPDRGSIYELM